MVNFGPLATEICWRVWGTPANFNGFRVLASLLQRRRSTEANQTLHNVWPSVSWDGTLFYAFRGLLPCYGILPGAKFTLHASNCLCALLYWQRYCTALQYWASAKLCGVEQMAPPIFGRAAITLAIAPRFVYDTRNMWGNAQRDGV